MRATCVRPSPGTFTVTIEGDAVTGPPTWNCHFTRRRPTVRRLTAPGCRLKKSRSGPPAYVGQTPARAALANPPSTMATRAAHRGRTTYDVLSSTCRVTTRHRHVPAGEFHPTGGADAAHCRHPGGKDV